MPPSKIYLLKSNFKEIIISLLDFIGHSLLFPLRFATYTNNPKNILVIRLDHIGDVVFSTVVAQNLKNHYKNSKIVFLVSSAAKDILINNPFIDELITFDALWFIQKKQNLWKFFGLVKNLSSYKFDLGIDLRGDIRHILIMALARIKYKVGYGITGGGFLLNKQISYRRNVHAIEHNLDLIRSLDIKLASAKPEIYTSQKDTKNASNLLKNAGITEKDFIVIIHPYANYSSKNWIDNRFAQLVDVLVKNYNAKIILVGSTKDTGRIANLSKLCTLSPLNFSGKTSLGTLFEVCKMAKLFIGVDSGPAHIAASTGIPIIVLFSGTNNSNEWSPIGDKVHIIEKNISCKNCGKLNCGNNRCMKLITVEEVLLKTKEAL